MARILSVTILVITSILVASTSWAIEKARVMVINSYHAEYPWVIAHNRVLTSELGDVAVLSYSYLDSKRLPQEQARQKADRVYQLFLEDRPDLVVIADDFALKTLGTSIMAKGVPVIFLGINNNPREYIGNMTLATGVLERPLLKRSVVYIQDIFDGKMKKCLILFDDGITALTILDQIFNGTSSLTFNWTTVDIELVRRYATWKQLVLTSKERGYDALILGLYHTIKDNSGNHIPDMQIADWTSANSPLPVFAFWDFAVGKDKAIGGLILSGEPQGIEAARLVKRVLKGESPQSIPPVTAEHGRFIFSRSELKRWNIQLPKYFEQPNEPLIFIE